MRKVVIPTQLTESKIPFFLACTLVITAGPVFVVFPQSPAAFFTFLVSLLVLYKMSIPVPLKLVGAVISLGIIMPSVGSENGYYMDVIIQVGIYVALAVGLNIVVGFAGLLDLGYVAFYAAGAYAYAIFATSQASNFIPAAWATFPVSGNWFWLFLLVGLVVGAITGVLLGFPVLRLRGDYLAIVTLGFGEIIRIVLNNLDKPINITNGPKGLTPIQPPALFGMDLSEPIHYYFIVLSIIILIIVVAKRLNASRIGRAWAAIREDELAARSMGINLLKMKLLAFASGASFAGVMGVVFAAKQTFIDPSSFSFMESIGILAMVILGGMGSVAGAVIGAVAVLVLQLQILKELSEYLGQLSAAGVLSIPSQLDPAKYERMIFGLILIAMCVFRPQGIIPAKRQLVRLRERVRDWRAKREGGEDVDPA
ncbi:MAG: branched-chain amino acid ABC transporter permease [Clostridia bacterium]|nr:branched-chain amino acid ABC transporter permease [Clostridia bacterium]MDQ7791412.1 branched-chain amino acid ABC transporter permease [Clostridia bacterium]